MKLRHNDSIICKTKVEWAALAVGGTTKRALWHFLERFNPMFLEHIV